MTPLKERLGERYKIDEGRSRGVWEIVEIDDRYYTLAKIMKNGQPSINTRNRFYADEYNIRLPHWQAAKKTKQIEQPLLTWVVRQYHCITKQNKVKF